MSDIVTHDTAIALIGMSGRFPGARTVNELWHNIIKQTVSIRPFSDDELWKAGVAPDLLARPEYVKAGAILDDVDMFDAPFFKYTPREAEITDPQHRIFLQCAWEALEDAGYDPERYSHPIGVFAGSAYSTYLLRHILPWLKDSPEDPSHLQLSIGSDMDALASTLSYKLDLQGPGIAVQTYCSTSLVAVHLACQSLLNYECDMALAGGVAISFPQAGYLYQEGGILSPDGVCRALDARGQGSVMGNGAGIVVLKRLDEAIEHGDQIYAVLLSSATNNDGSVRVSYSAPGLRGQTAVIAQAISDAGIDAETIGYIETHGTGTALGDSIELAAMQRAFARHTSKKQFCAIGSVKPNVGHLDRASGVTGLLKATLALKHKVLPPSVHFESASADLKLEDSPFYVNTSPQPWKAEHEPRRAGVSSFGVGGTNAHVILEEAPERIPSNPAEPWQLLLLSAKSELALEQATHNLALHLREQPELNLADVAYTLQVGRSAFNHRRFVIGQNLQDAVATLEKSDPALPRMFTSYQEHRDQPVAFLLPDLGEQHAQTIQELYQQEARFREAYERCLTSIERLTGLDMASARYPGTMQKQIDPQPDPSHTKARTQSPQLAVAFAFAYALAQLLLQWGIAPQALLGDGLGEWVAACLADIFSLEDALKLVLRLEQVVQPQTPTKADEIQTELTTLIQTFTLHPPRLPIYSNNTGTWITAEQALDPTYWTRHITQLEHSTNELPGQFNDMEYILIEVGQNQTGKASHSALGEKLITLLPASHEPQTTRKMLLGALGQLWLAGVTIDWQKLAVSKQRQRLSLPTYPFERKRYWIAPTVTGTLPLSHAKKADIADWFYLPGWQSAPLNEMSQRTDTRAAPWLIFLDEAGLGEQLAMRLIQEDHTVIRVQTGQQFVQVEDLRFFIRPEQNADYLQLWQTLCTQGQFPGTIVHCWSVTHTATASIDIATFRQAQQVGFYSLLHITQALVSYQNGQSVQILILSSNAQAIQDQASLQPEKGTLLAACHVISQENSHILCRSIDIASDELNDRLADLVYAELVAQTDERAVVYRQQQRWIQAYQAKRLEAPQTPVAGGLREHGVYLITGGLGSISLVLAEYLARTVQARLVLLGRSALPDKAAWQAWLQEHTSEDPTSLKIQKLQAIEALGAEVLTCAADVADAEQMSLVLERVHQQFGTLHGVIHAAGTSDERAYELAATITKDQCEQHFQPKVYGAYVLEQVLQGETLDFCILFSSLSAVLGGLGFAGYAAANMFLDAFTQKHNQLASTPWVSIDWDTWRVREQMRGELGATIAEYSMSPGEGLEAFARILAANELTRVIHSTSDLHTRIRQWIMLETLRGNDEPGLGESLTSSVSTTMPGSLLHDLTTREDCERKLREIWQRILGIDEVGIYDNFFDLGGNSLNGLQVVAAIKKVFLVQLPIVTLFEAPTISALAHFLRPAIPEASVIQQQEMLQQRRNRARRDTKQDDIAIIGMVGRFPGASTVKQFWQNLCDGIESITFFTDEELLAAGVDPQVLQTPEYVRARPVLEQIDQFDASFFGYSPREADLTDPQHRLFLECAWEALEQAGYDCQTYEGLIGVFGGQNLSTYLWLLAANNVLQTIDAFQIVSSNDKDSLTTSVSYKLNLRGPSIAVQTFCSTSLVAIHLACQSLAQGECDMTLAGGISIRVPDRVGYLYAEGGQESPDGHCRAFDGQAQGSVIGDGVGVVVLKRLSDALEDGDTIHAVIKGSAINNDGSLKVSYTAPSVTGQAEVVKQALANAGVSAESIGYIEAHGTGTKLGDPIEIASLTKAFATHTEKAGYCAIGSLKTNVGHLDRAAGVAGLIKAVMVLKHGHIPPTLYFHSSNPEIDFAHSPFFVNNQPLAWPAQEQPRRAGVNSLGMGGTNAHVIVEEAPAPEPSSPSHPWHLLVLSARTETALQVATQNLEQYFQEHEEINLTDATYTLQRGRSAFPHRRVLVCGDRADALKLLGIGDADRSLIGYQERRDRAVAFLFPGVGEQTAGMTRELYEAEPTFRETVDQCCILIKPLCNLDFHDVLYPPTLQHASPARVSSRIIQSRERQTGAESVIRSVELAQPAVFILEYALARLFMQWGIAPQALIGYSLGEYVAACLAGVLSLEDALTLVTKRAQLISTMPEGMMLVVARAEEELHPYLDGQPVDLAIVNTPNTCTLAGPPRDIMSIEEQLQAHGIACYRVETSHAFHSQMLQPLRETFLELVHNTQLHAPQIPYVSNVTGTWITAEQATTPAYWADHMCQTVRFADDVERLLQDTEYVLLEVGPGQTLSSFVRQHPACKRERFSLVISTLAHGHERHPEPANVLLALGKLWLAGVTPNWSGLYKGERRRRIALPTYPFERQRHWIANTETSRGQTLTQGKHRQLERKTDIADWFYRAQWIQAPLATEAEALVDSSWLIFADETGLGEQVGMSLANQGHTVIYVRPGKHFARLENDVFTIAPAEQEQYSQLFTTLARDERLPQRLIHCWQVSSVLSSPPVADTFNACQETGFYSLLYLAKGLSPHLYDEPVQILVFSTQSQDVTGQEIVRPEKTTILGACTVISQEPLNLVCRCIDIDMPETENWQGAFDIEYLVDECLKPATETHVAYRSRTRWKQEYEAYSLPAPEAAHLPFRQQGVYLLTGGLGGIGLQLAEYLARTVQARLVLLGRSALPARQTWEEWLATHDAQDEISAKIRRLQAIEASGSLVSIYQVDIADQARLQEIVQEVMATYGTLHGVFHAAGIVDSKVFKSVQDISRVECETHFQAKIHGTHALARVLDNIPLDFCLLFSSLSAVLGGLGFAAYAAANVYLDAFTHWYNRRAKTRWISVNWDTWEVRENSHGVLGGTIAAFAMQPDESINALTRVLTSGQTHLINSTGDLHARLRQWRRTDLLQQQSKHKQPAGTGADLTPTAGHYEQMIKEIWQEVLGLKEIGIYENFFDLGGNSLIGVEVIAKLKKALHRAIPAVALFEAPTISLLTRYLQPEQEAEPAPEREILHERRERTRKGTKVEGVAVIGMSGRFPGAATIEQFWHNISNGVESISFFSPEELEAAGVDPQLIQAKNYVPARPILAPELVEQFDAAFFGYSPREAELTDPQHRLFLECAWEALEQAGYDTQTYDGLIGTFGGTNISTYVLAADPARLKDVNNYQLLAGNDKDSLTSKVSYKLNLRGPSLAIQTFCSTSLVATHLACQSLLYGECDIALAGGVSINVPSVRGHLYEPGGMESPDGHCRTFDAQAQGSMFGDGISLVVLKRLAEAIEDGDSIQAVIKGSAINNDGSQKVSYAAPSVAGQAAVVQAALTNAGISAEDISYIEAHGTATELGDPIEIASLTRAFRTQTDQVGFCPIGSVKTNVGHLDRAAGLTGLIKTILSLQHEQIPASLHFQSPNPEIDFEQSPFFVNTELRSWQRGQVPRRAGVNSLGMGGTNAHVIVEEAPLQEASGPSRPWQLLLLSARSEQALADSKHRLYDFLNRNDNANIADVAYTLQRGRRRFEYRAAFLCRDCAEATRLLETPTAQVNQMQSRIDRPVAFLFPGVGEQYVGMTQELYQQEPVFRKIVDQCCNILQGILGRDVREIVFPAVVQQPAGNGDGPGSIDLRALLGRNGREGTPSLPAASADLYHTEVAQCLTFVIEYALAQLLIQWGVQPRAMLGYSLGEYVAACLSGVFSLEDGLKLVAQRALWISELPAGAMIAVSLPEEQLSHYVDQQVNLAVVNSPTTCVLAGPTEHIARLSSRLEQDDIVFRPIKTTHAFHSAMLEELQERLTAFVSTFRLNNPRIPYISNITGTWITNEQATDPSYWSRHMCQTVRFASGVGQLLQAADEYMLLEVGPGQSLTSFVKQHPDCIRERLPLIRTTLPAFYEKESEQAFLLRSLSQLWLWGVNIDWFGFSREERRIRLPLPTYPFERKRYWIDSQKTPGLLPGSSPSDPTSSLMHLKREALADWFYLPGWRSIPPSQAQKTQHIQEKTGWIVFLDEYGIGTAITAHLQGLGAEVITVRSAQQFARHGITNYSLNPVHSADYALFFKDREEDEQKDWNIIHLWSIGKDDQPAEDALHAGFSSLFTLAQSLGDANLGQCQLIVISNDVQSVTGYESLSPVKATLTGPCRVLPQEYLNLRCRNIDLALPPSGSQQEKELVRQVIHEIISLETETLVALRANRRWVPSFEAVHLENVEHQALPLRQGGVYLITGGLGGIGLAVADFLAREYQARLVLVGRRGLPPREQWEHLVTTQGDERNEGQKIQQVRELEALGSEVLILPADVRSKEQMQAVLAQIQERFGGLHGVFHTAGVPGVGLTQFKTPKQAREVLAPKVDGTLVLEEVLTDTEVELIVLFSSVTAWTGGGPGQIDYSAANAFLGAYAQSQHKQGQRVVTIDWNEWQWNAWEAGLAGYDSDIQTILKENRQKVGITFAEGIEALKRVLAMGQPQMIVSTQNFPQVIAESKRLTAAYILQQKQHSSTASEAHARPALLDSYAPARNETEQRLVALWEALLGITPIGINDNFFELGGNSLSGIDLIARLRKTFQLATLASYVLYEAPTISKMALYLTNGKSTQLVTERHERGEKRRASQKRNIHDIKGNKTL